MAWEPVPAAVMYHASFREKIEALLPAGVSQDQGILQGDWCYWVPVDVCLQRPETEELIRDLSRVAPLLYYAHVDGYGGVSADEEYEDAFSGFGYRIYDGGKERARAYFDYRWPTWGDALREAVHDALQRSSPECFARFDLPLENSAALQSLLDEKYILSLLDEADLAELAQRVQALLGIDECFQR